MNPPADRCRGLRVVRPLLFFCALALGGALAAEFPIRLSGDNPLLPTQVAPGGHVIFSFDSSRAPAASLQWFFNDTAIPGATASALELSGVTTANTGNYRLLVTDPSSGSTWSETRPLNVIAPPPSPVDRTFRAAFPSEVFSVVPKFVTADGSIILTEYFTPNGTRYARLHADGSADASFVFPSSAGTILAAADDGRLLTTNAPFRLAPDGTAAPLTLPDFFDATQPLTAALVQPDGKFLLAQAGRLVRFTPAGTVDATFAASSASSDKIQWLRIDPQQRLLVARQLSGGQTLLERLTPAGTKDASFTPPTELPWIYARLFSACNDLVPQRSGGYLAEVLGTSVMRLNDDGSLDLSWGLLQTTTFYPRAWEFKIAATADGLVFVTSTLGRSSFRRYRASSGSVAADPAFYPGTSTFPSGEQIAAGVLLPAPNGQLLVAAGFTAWDGHPTQLLARIAADTTPTPVAAPVANAYVDQLGGFSRRLAAGQRAVLSTSIESGLSPFTFQWVALDGQPLPPDSNSPLIVLAAFTPGQAGRYQVRVTGPGGTTLSGVATLTFDPEPIYLANLSGRAVAGRNEASMIGGFVVPTASKLLLRGVGPSLGPLGIAHPLAEPLLQLSNGTAIDASTNTAAARTLSAEVGASPLLADSLDAVGIVEIPAGPTTARLSARPAADTGVALAEIYATSAGDAPVNLSFRAQTAPGEDTAIAGFVLADPGETSSPAKLLLRAVGPTLATQGVVHPLVDPVLTVYDSAGHVVAQNDNWPSHLTAEYTAYDSATDKVGAFHLLENSKDAGLLLDLPAGAYSLHATGGSGVVLLEIYLVH